MTDQFLEDLHEKIDTVEETIIFLRSAGSPIIEMRDISAFCLMLYDVSGLTSGNTDLATILRVPATTLRRMMKFEGNIDRHAALTIADRTRSFLKSLDTVSPPPPIPTPEPAKSSTTPPAKEKSETITFRAEKWVIVDSSRETQEKIAALVILLESVILQINGANIPPEDQILNQVERKQLIAILETALALLNAPAVEVGLLKKLGRSLGESARKAAERQMQEGLGQVMGSAASSLRDWITSLIS